MRIDHNTTKKLWPNRRRNSVEKTSPNLQHIDGATIAADNNSSAILKSGIKMTLEASIASGFCPECLWMAKFAYFKEFSKVDNFLCVLPILKDCLIMIIFLCAGSPLWNKSLRDL